MGYDVTVIASLISFNEEGRSCLLDKESVHYENGYKVIRIDYKQGLLRKIYQKLRIYPKLYDVLEQEQPNIIFTHGIDFGSYPAVIKYINNYPETILYGDNHGDFVNSAQTFLSKQILYKVVWRYCVKKLVPYITMSFRVTPLRCNFLIQMYKVPKEKVEFLPMGIDDDAIPQNRKEVRDAIRSQLNIKDTDFVIFTGGKIDRRKNIQNLLKVITSINDDRVHVIICGVVAPEMQEEINGLLTGNIHMMGWCNADKVMENMVASDIACFPGTHSTLWEQSVGIGLPCVFKKWNGMTHVDMGGNSIFIDGENIEELTSTIKSIVYTERFERIKQVAGTVAENFRYSNIARKAIGLK